MQDDSIYFTSHASENEIQVNFYLFRLTAMCRSGLGFVAEQVSSLRRRPAFAARRIPTGHLAGKDAPEGKPLRRRKGRAAVTPFPVVPLFPKCPVGIPHTRKGNRSRRSETMPLVAKAGRSPRFMRRCLMNKCCRLTRRYCTNASVSACRGVSLRKICLTIRKIPK